MASIRVPSKGSPVSDKSLEAPFKQGDFYVFEVEDDVARYWNKIAPKRKEELSEQSRRENKDIRLILDPFVHRPRHTK